MTSADLTRRKDHLGSISRVSPSSSTSSEVSIFPATMQPPVDFAARKNLKIHGLYTLNGSPCRISAGFTILRRSSPPYLLFLSSFFERTRRTPDQGVVELKEDRRSRDTKITRSSNMKKGVSQIPVIDRSLRFLSFRRFFDAANLSESFEFCRLVDAFRQVLISGSVQIVSKKLREETRKHGMCEELN